MFIIKTYVIKSIFILIIKYVDVVLWVYDRTQIIVRLFRTLFINLYNNFCQFIFDIFSILTDTCRFYYFILNMVIPDSLV